MNQRESVPVNIFYLSGEMLEGMRRLFFAVDLTVTKKNSGSSEAAKTGLRS